jgi:hypothetical protein
VTPPSGTATETATAQPTNAVCVGDCDASGEVGINELIVGVNIALGGAPVSACAALDSDASGTVEISELIAAVNNALSGCAAARR